MSERNPTHFDIGREPRLEVAPKRTAYDPTDLWERYFWVKVNTLDNMNAAKVRDFGVRITGIEELDAQLDKQETVCQWNIDMMFERWRRGIEVRVINYPDTVTIYDIIQAHLRKWAQYLQNGVNVGDAPMKDLIELDAFSAKIYDKAKTIFTLEERKLAAVSNFAGSNIRTMSSFLQSRTTQDYVVETEHGRTVTKGKNLEKLPDEERVSYRNVFEEQAGVISAWKRQRGDE